MNSYSVVNIISRQCFDAVVVQMVFRETAKGTRHGGREQIADTG